MNSTRGQRFLTFATARDWEAVLVALEASLPVKYIKSGFRALPDVEVFTSFRDLPHFGIARFGNAPAAARYLVLPIDAAIATRQVILDSGEPRYIADHANNTDSVIFAPGGIFESKTLIHGEVSKLSGSPSATEVFRTFGGLIKRQFPAVKSFRVGPEARALAAAGWRLTGSISAAKSFDLAFD